MFRLGSAPDDEPVEIDLEAAAKWLLGNDTGDEALNRQSVRLYDFADMSETSAAHRNLSSVPRRYDISWEPM